MNNERSPQHIIPQTEAYAEQWGWGIAAALGVVAIGAGAILPLGGKDSRTDEEKFANGLNPNANVLVICDGANIRDDPAVNASEVVATVDYGNAPAGTCFPFKVSGVYSVANYCITYDGTRTTCDHNGMWYGISESEAAEMFPGLQDQGWWSSGLDPENEGNIVWINEQRARPQYPSQENKKPAQN